MKHEAPAFRMIVQDLSLVPAAAWDQERLSTYRNRSIVNVHITQEKNRKLERKYWAILGEVIKSCPIKQRTKEDLHKAIRLKLGVVDAYFTFGGHLRVEVKSTSTMDDPEYQQFYEEAMALLHKETGVDPEQLSANSPDVGEDEQEPPSAAPSTEDAGSDGSQALPRQPQAVAADPSEPASGGPAPADEVEAREEPGASSAGEHIDPVKRMLMEEAIDNMLRDAFSEPAIERPTKVDKLRDVFLEPQNLADFPDFVNRCHETARRVIGKPAEKERAREYLRGRIPA